MDGYANEALRLAHERQDGFLRERAIERIVASQPKRSRFAGIAAAVSAARTTLSAVDTDFSLPVLKEYPYRS